MSFEHGKSTTVKTPKGYLRGYKKDNVYHFCGIDYGKAKRWQIAEDIQSWEGVKEATNYGFTCYPFRPDTTGNTLKSPHRFWINSEDCLNLNLWTRSIEPGVRKPVLVWFHGGGFNNGSALDLYAFDGCNICDKGDVVVVTINHRLNILGYLDLRAYGEKYANSVNVGNWDLICALRWVRDNIECFGGDPDNVTIFGQSGGGGKTISVMNMEASAGLYHKSMVMSGVTDNLLGSRKVTSGEIVARMFENLGITTVEELEKLHHHVIADSYLQAYQDLAGNGMAPLGPVKNIDYLGDPMEFGFTDYAKSVPMIIGTNFSEFFNLPAKYSRCDMSDQQQREAVEEVLGSEIAQKALPEFLKVFPDKKPLDILQYDATIFRKGTRKFVRCRVEAGCAPTYVYFFCPTININDGSMPQHNSDISYFFYNTEMVPSNDIGEDTAKLEEEMSGRLVQYAWSSKPQLEGHIEWPQATAENCPVLLFDRNTRVAEGMDDGFIDELGKSPYYNFRL